MAASDPLRSLVVALEELRLRYALGGSIATIAYGQPRSTLDIDVVVDLVSDDIDRLKSRFDEPEFYLDVEAARLAANGDPRRLEHPDVPGRSDARSQNRCPAAALHRVVDEVFPVEARDVERAKEILLAIADVSARDALHAAIMQRYGIEEILTFDAGFDRMPGLKRVSI